MVKQLRGDSVLLVRTETGDEFMTRWGGTGDEGEQEGGETAEVGGVVHPGDGPRPDGRYRQRRC